MIQWTESRTYLSLQGGLTFSVPFTLFGAFILLLQNYTPDIFFETANHLWDIDLNLLLGQVNHAIFSTISLWSSYGVAATYVAQEKPSDKSIAGLTGLVAYLILTVEFLSTKEGYYLNMDTVGANGILLSLLSSLLVGICFSAVTNHIQKKNQDKSTSDLLFGDHVAENNSKIMTIVRESFDPLIPVFVCLGLALMGNVISMIVFRERLVFVFEAAVQAPFVYAADRLPVLLGFDFTISFLDWFGLHGIKITETVTTPLAQINIHSNQAIVDSGQTLVIGQNAAYYTGQYQMFARGASYISLIFAILLFSHRETERKAAKFALVPSLFNINEAIRFGLPVVLNPRYFLPLILAPVAGNLIVYLALTTGFLAPFTMIKPPWTTPYIIYGFLSSGFRGAVVEGLILLVDVLIYAPFVRYRRKL